MSTFIAVVQVIAGLLVAGLFFLALLTAMAKELRWPRLLLWIVGSLAIAPIAAPVGYLIGSLYSVNDGPEGGTFGFAGAGLIIGLFLFLHCGTSTQWYRQRMRKDARDFPVTWRIVLSIVAAAIAGVILAAMMFPFPFPDGVQRLLLVSPFLFSWVGLFIGCALEARARSKEEETEKQAGAED